MNVVRTIFRQWLLLVSVFLGVIPMGTGCATVRAVSFESSGPRPAQRHISYEQAHATAIAAGVHPDWIVDAIIQPHAIIFVERFGDDGGGDNNLWETTVDRFSGEAVAVREPADDSIVAMIMEEERQTILHRSARFVEK